MNRKPRPERLPVRAWSRDVPLWRIHRHDRAAVWFGPDAGFPPLHRFDAPSGEYRVCYFGDSPEAAFAETLLRGAWPVVVQRSTLAARVLTRIPLGRELRLALLHGEGLVKLGLDGEVVHGHPYAVCQQLAHAVWAHADAVDGIEYRSRWDTDRLCVALFDRAASALGPAAAAETLADRRIVRPLLRTYGVGLVD